MRIPRSRLAKLAWILGTLLVAGVVAVVLVRVGGRARLERALLSLRASGGPELPPQVPEVTEGGQRTAAWFAQFEDEQAWERDELASARSIDAFLAAHGREPEVAPFAEDLGLLARALRIEDEALAAKRRELEHPSEFDRALNEMVGTTQRPDALASLEYERAYEVREAAQKLLEQQVATGSWDAASRAWIVTRGLGHAELLRRAGEIVALEPFDPPPGRGIERFSIRTGRVATTVIDALVDVLPALALRGEVSSFARVTEALLACGGLYARGWGIVPADMAAWTRHRVAARVSECLQFLPAEASLGPIEAALASFAPREAACETWKRERAVGNEIFVDFRGQTTEAARVLDGFGWVQREGLRLWLDHEQAGYLELLARAIELEPRAPCDIPGGLEALDAIVAELREPRPWQLLRSWIIPDLRGEARRLATLEVRRDFARLCIGAWRDHAAPAARIAATRDPFTGRPYALREEAGVLVLSSPGDGSEPIEARLRMR